MHYRSNRAIWLSVAVLGLGAGGVHAQDPKDNPPQEQPARPVNPNLPPKLPPQPGPDPIPVVQLGPTLPTHRSPRTTPGPNWITADASPLPLDREGIWILDFAFRPMRMIEVEIPGKGTASAPSTTCITGS